MADYLGLERNVALASAAVFLLGFGEELWKKFLPKYLERLGAGPGVVGLFGTAEDFFDAVYQYPAGRITDRVGRKPFVIATFVCFALYPVAVLLPTGFASLALAFVVAGAIGLAGTVVFAATVEERCAS